MENKLPNSFVAFITSIVEAETQTDLWKSKLFYLPIQDVFALLQNYNSNHSHHSLSQPNQNNLLSQTPQNNESSQISISLEQILKFIESNNQCELSQEEQKVIQKYFSFAEKLTCSHQSFIKKLKPVNNKLILTIERQQLSTQQCLKGLFKSILSGYEKINPLRQECANSAKQILAYFRSRQLQKSPLSYLTKESLKQLMFEANIYGRVNFLYAKEYIFGEKDKDEIEWSVLLGVQLIQQIDVIDLSTSNNTKEISYKEQKLYDKIDELEEQHIVTEKIIPCQKASNQNLQMGIINKEKEQNESQQEQVQRGQFEQIGQKWKAEQKRDEQKQKEKERSQEQKDESYRKNLSQINYIQDLLNKTKQRYQKNKQLLQNQTNLIKNEQLKRTQSKGKYNYTALLKSSNQQPQLQSPNNKKQNLINGEQISNNNQNIIKPDQSQRFSYSYQATRKNTNTIKVQTPSPQKPHLYQPDSPQLKANNDNNLREKDNLRKMEQSFVKPYMSRQSMKKQIDQTYQQNAFNTPHQQKTIISPYRQNTRNNSYQQSFINNMTTFSNRNNSTQRRQIGKIKRRSKSKDQINQTNINPSNTPTFTQTKSLQQSNYDVSKQTNSISFQQKTYVPLQKKNYNISEQINNDTFKQTNTNDYQQYEAVLKQIKREESQYKKILQIREKILLEKQSNKKRLTLDINPNQSSPDNSNLQKRYTPINSLLGTPTKAFKSAQNSSLLETPADAFKKQQANRVSASTEKKQQAKRVSASNQKPTISNSRYEEIMKEIEANSLAKSRVSSKKREQIVQKATSEARLRIQQIQSRALKRLGRTDDSERFRKSGNYLKQENSLLEKQYEMPKYRKNVQSSLHLGTKSHQSISSKNYLMNDMLNQRPTGLRITSNYRQKY